MPSRGGVEHQDAWVIANDEQVSRYWGKYTQVLVTNHRDFVPIGQDVAGKPTKRYGNLYMMNAVSPESIWRGERSIRK